MDTGPALGPSIASDAEAANEASPLTIEELHERLLSTQERLEQSVRDLQELQRQREEFPSTLSSAATAKIELDEAELARMSKAQRQAAVKRARNREAARRSRARKAEQIASLTAQVTVLQEENVFLLRCIEDITAKAIAEQNSGAALRRHLERLGEPSQFQGQQQQQQLRAEHINEDTLHAQAQAEAEAEAEASIDAVVGIPAPSGAPVAVEGDPAAIEGDPAAMARSLLPSLHGLEDLQRAGAQATSRGRGSALTSARGAAVGEHIALLSKENSPRDEDGNPTGEGAGTAAPAAGAGAAVPPAQPAAAPPASATTMAQFLAPPPSK